MIKLMTKAIEYKQMKRHRPIRKAIMQIISMRVSWFVAIADLCRELHIRNGKTSMIDVFSQGCGIMEKIMSLNDCLEVILVIPCWPYSEFLSSASSKTRVFSKY